MAEGTSWTLPIRPELVDEKPYGAPQLEVRVRLNTNENPYPLDVAVAADIGGWIAEIATRLNRYPDREAWALRADLADYLGHGLTPERVWAANGSNEVVQQIFQAFGGPGRTALSFLPTYSMYPEYARNTHTTWLTAERTDAFAIDPDEARATIERLRPDVVVLASPNNPTGTVLPLSTIKAIADVAPGIVVVDEAYAEFSRDRDATALALLDSFPAIAVTRTMSKAFSLAGARVGYLAASAEFVDALRIVRLPYHLSAVTQAVARVALAHRTELLGAVERLREERDELVTWLRWQRLGDGTLSVAESDANFVLFGKFPDRHAIWQALLDHGVLVREVGPAGWLRVSMGTPTEIAAFKSALVRVLGESTTKNGDA
jgi:histidinol-phosphate aminotransferase